MDDKSKKVGVGSTNDKHGSNGEEEARSIREAAEQIDIIQKELASMSLQIEEMKTQSHKFRQRVDAYEKKLTLRDSASRMKP